MNPFDVDFYQSAASIPFVIATASPLLIAVLVFFMSRGIRPLSRAALLVAVWLLSLPIGFVFVLMSLDAVGLGGTAGAGVAAIPMALVWLLTIAAIAAAILGAAIVRARRKAVGGS